MSYGDSTPPAGNDANAQASNKDIILSSLRQAVSVAVNLDQDAKKAEAAACGVRDYLQSLLSGVPGPPDPPAEDTADDKSKPPDPTIAPLRAQRKLSVAQAENAFAGSEGTAAAELHAAVSAWRLALSAYDFAIVNANSQLQQAVNTAQETYTQKLNNDSQSRQQFLFFQLKAAVSAALITFQGAVTTAGAALAAAAGTLLEAYIAYLTTVASAEATLLNARASAVETFWQSVESVRDAV